MTGTREGNNAMIDYISYLTAQERTARQAREALPESPVRPDEGASAARHWVSATLRRFADRLEPVSHGGAPVSAGSRC